MITPSEKIWPWWLRLTHWLVALGIFLLWLLAYMYYETDTLHRWLGYGVLGFVIMRVAAGFFTAEPAAQLNFPSWSQLTLHIEHFRKQQLPITHGHNPLGQIAVYVMWTLIVLLGFTGWLSRTDAYWGEDWPVELHARLSQLLMICVFLHVCAVFVVSKYSNQRLIKQMIDGELHQKD